MPGEFSAAPASSTIACSMACLVISCWAFAVNAIASDSCSVDSAFASSARTRSRIGLALAAVAERPTSGRRTRTPAGGGSNCSSSGSRPRIAASRRTLTRASSGTRRAQVIAQPWPGSCRGKPAAVHCRIHCGSSNVGPDCVPVARLARPRRRSGPGQHRQPSPASAQCGSALLAASRCRTARAPSPPGPVRRRHRTWPVRRTAPRSGSAASACRRGRPPRSRSSPADADPVVGADGRHCRRTCRPPP